ncbi:hypothetical protein AB0J40_07870 [Amycolatopsis sp. NPDC049691]|uniref:hypothetical protein n=1 Tax=Amycolatopsis sp. NPDC049691 TaxID=3155155 RepID=UPI0034260D7A
MSTGPTQYGRLGFTTYSAGATSDVLDQIGHEQHATAGAYRHPEDAVAAAADHRGRADQRDQQSVPGFQSRAATLLRS